MDLLSQEKMALLLVLPLQLKIEGSVERNSSIKI